MSKFQIRQGDVFLEEVDDIPADVTKVAADKQRGHVLAEGEVTGHSHRIPKRYAGKAVAYRTETDARFLQVTAPVPLRHEEHRTVCAMCSAHVAGAPMPIATHRIANDFTAAAYRCSTHAGPDAVALAEPGATDLPAKRYERTIHVEYVPGELAREVVD